MALNTDQQKTVRDLAQKYGLPQDLILGLVDKESNGKVFWSVFGHDMPAIRPEGHYFYKYLTGAARLQAQKQGLAAKSAGVVKVPSKYEDRYRMFQRMVAINPQAAMMSISMGIGQVMGANYKSLGYANVKDMWDECRSGLEGQVAVILKFIKASPSLTKACRSHDYATVARLYNGPGYKANHYDTDLKKFTLHYSEGTPHPAVAIEAGWDKRITDLGFNSPADFQKANGLVPDGIVGKLTKAAVVDKEQKAHEEVHAPVKDATSTAKTGTAVVVIAGAAEGIKETVETFTPVADALKGMTEYAPMIIGGIAAVIVVAALVTALYRWSKIVRANTVLEQRAAQ